MKCLSAFLLFGLILAGCGQREETVYVAQDVGAAPSAPDVAPIPEEVMTEGLRYFGAPFERAVEYAVVISGEEHKAVRTLTHTLADGVVTITSRWDGALDVMPVERFVATTEGVMLIEQNGPIEPPQTQLPASLATGQTWTVSYEFPHPQGGANLRVNSTSRVIGRETVTVPLGEFEAIVIEETGTMKGEGVDVRSTGKIHLVAGIGLVKVTQTYVSPDQTNELALTARSFAGGN